MSAKAKATKYNLDWSEWQVRLCWVSNQAHYTTTHIEIHNHLVSTGNATTGKRL